MEGMFRRQKKKGCVEGRAFMSFLDYMKSKKQNCLSTLSIQKLKSSFVYFLRAETTLCIKEALQCLFVNIEWLESK